MVDVAHVLDPDPPPPPVAVIVTFPVAPDIEMPVPAMMDVTTDDDVRQLVPVLVTMPVESF